MTNLKVLATVVIVSTVFGLAGAVRGQSRSYFFWSWFLASLKFFAGVLIAAFYFLVSAGLSPDGKSNAISPFSPLMMTKTWLAPFALWSFVSFYFFEIVRPAKVRAWIVLGLITGFVGSLACVAIGFLLNRPYADPSLIFFILLAPVVYLPVWYGFAAFRAYRLHPIRPYHLLLTLTAQLADWMWAARSALDVYEALPPIPPDCYVVTASTNGYSWLVNRKQLEHMRAFEQLWKEKWPRTHRFFRQFYNVVGPFMARRIRHPFLASLGYLTIKPFEILAVVVMALCSNNSERTLH